MTIYLVTSATDKVQSFLILVRFKSTKGEALRSTEYCLRTSNRLLTIRNLRELFGRLK